ncbi:hypothetical protein GCM10010129_07280 [Streptomyces fumigatiscleroticus]|nr:hypothetical protein GCM10010129_07280 [Streptomyces fumigatiscleroticus]
MTHGTAPAPPRSTRVVTAHAGDFVWRAGGAIALAAPRGEKATIAGRLAVRRGVRLNRDAGPGPGLAHQTTAEAHTRPYPQITKELA